MSGDLTPKQAQFVKEYLVDLNATQAAIRAGYSARTAAEAGYENLRKPQIAAAVQAAMDARAERTEISADYVLDGIRETVENCKRQDGAAYASAALKGYELLGKHLKLFTEKHEHTGKDGEPLNPETRAETVALIAAAIRGGGK